MDANYKAAEQLMNEEKYDRAAMRFELFPDYQDSREQYNKCEFSYAKQLFAAEQYDAAYRAFSSVGSYEDAPYLSAVSQFDAIVTGSSYSEEEMQNALLILSANSNYEDAQTILATHIYDRSKLLGRWSLGNAYLVYELAEGGGNRLTACFDGVTEKIYDNVVFNDARVTTADGSETIMDIYGFEPYTSSQPGTVSFHAAELGEDVVFNRQ